MMNEKVLIFDHDTAPITIVLDQPHTSLRLIGLTIADDSDQIVAPIHIRHSAPNTTSEIYLKSVLSGEAVRDGEVLVTIEKGAKGAKTRLETRALLLSPKARAKTKPILEILENDVQASHAATTGPLDENALFYLQSRGVSIDDARQVLIWGFLQSDLNKIADKQQRQQIEKQLQKLLRTTQREAKLLAPRTVERSLASKQTQYAT